MCCVQSLSSVQLCGPLDYSPPGSSAHGIFQARTLQLEAISYSKASSWPRHRICTSCVSCTGRWILKHRSVSQFSHSVMSNSLWPHGLQHARPSCPSPTPKVCSNSCPSSRWYHPIIPSSGIPFSSLLQSFPASGSLPKSQFFTSGGQSVKASASASVLPMNI